MIQMENTFFALAERFNRDCIIICDRGTMDASACKFYLNLVCKFASFPLELLCHVLVFKKKTI